MPSSKFQGFCEKTKQATIRRHRTKFFQLVLKQTGDVEMAREILKARPHATYVQGLGTVFSDTSDPDLTELQNVAVEIPE